MKSNIHLVEMSFGFSILERKQKLKIDLNAAGEAGLISLIAACIDSGIKTQDHIVHEISDITGFEGVDETRILLMELENSYWGKNQKGTFYMLPDPEDRAYNPFRRFAY